MRKYICKESWKRHTKGEVITDWEFKKLPVEIKKHFELVSEVKFERQIIRDEIHDFVANQEDPGVITVPVPSHPFSGKKKKIEAIADINSMISDETQDNLDTK